MRNLILAFEAVGTAVLLTVAIIDFVNGDYRHAAVDLAAVVLLGRH